MRELPFATSFATSAANPANAEDLLNIYVEIEPGQAETKIIRVGRPGIEQRKLFTAGGDGRGMYVFNDELWFVVGERLYSMSASEDVTGRGILDTGGRVYFADDGNNLALVTSGTMYVWQPIGGLNEVSDPDFTSAGSLAYLDGYGVFNQPGTDKFYVTNLRDFTSVDALDFATAERASDPILRTITLNGEIWLIGTRTTEVWYNSGASFPLARRNVTIQRGTAATESVVEVDGRLILMGDDRVMYATNGYGFQRISTHSIERTLRQSGDVSQAEAFVWRWDGHVFYTLTIPSVGTFVYDLVTQLWWRANTFGVKTWNIRHAAAFNGHVYCLGRGNELYRFNEDALTDDGTVILRQMVSSPIHANREKFSLQRYELRFDTGRVTIDEQSPEPVIGLETSRDGRVFGSQKLRSLGATGDYEKRVRFNRLGQFRSCTVRVKCTDEVKFRHVGTYGEFI